VGIFGFPRVIRRHSRGEEGFDKGERLFFSENLKNDGSGGENKRRGSLGFLIRSRSIFSEDQLLKREKD